ncbi:MAG TPA: MFS transporter [Streptosporangiaceae bacterium]
MTGSFSAFRRVWLGATASAAGDAASWIALVALALATPHASIALLAICYTAPVAVGGLAAGWALDRFDRRRLMIIDATARAAVFALIPISAAFSAGPAGQQNAVPLPLIYSVAAVYGLLKMISLAGFPALIPQLVDDDQLSRANALEGASYGLASLTGAGFAGLVIGAFGHNGAIGLVAADALSYLAFAVLLRTVTPRQLPRPERAGTPASLTEVIRLVLRRPVLRTITAMFALFNIGEGMLLVFLPRRSAEIGLGAGGYGYLVAALTCGELAAAALLARRDWRRPLVPSILISQVAAALIVLTLIIPTAASTILAMAALGFVSAPMTAWAQTLRMREAPTTMHGRLFALLRTAMQATPPIGAAAAAGLSHFGASALLGCVAAVMGLPVLAGAADVLRVPPPVPQPEA